MLAKDLGVSLDERGYIQVDRQQATNIPGAFAAGDITNATELKQFITSASEGSIAAQSAYNYLHSLHGGYR
jgi:thioredoxin reductase (NADPH)